MKTKDAQMTLTFITKEPMKHKPHWVSVDSTTVVLPNGKEIFFDFLDSCGYSTELQDGRYEIEYTKSNFDIEHFRGEDSHCIETDLDWSEIAKGVFKDIHIDGDSSPTSFDDLFQGSFLFTAISFDAFEPDTGSNKEFSLSQEQLDFLNKNIEETYPSEVATV